MEGEDSAVWGGEGRWGNIEEHGVGVGASYVDADAEIASNGAHGDGSGSLRAGR